MSRRGNRRKASRGAGKKNLRKVKQQNSLRRGKKSGRKPRPSRPGPATQRTRPAASTASSAESFSSEISMIEMKENSVRHRMNLDSIQADLNTISNAFVEIPNQIAKINRRGFVFTKDMDDALALSEDEWLSGLQTEVEADFDSRLDEIANAAKGLDRTLAQLVKPNKFIVEKAENEVERVEGLILSAESALRGRFSSIKSTIDEIYADLEEANRGLDLLNDSEIKLRGAEALVLVAEAEWEIDGEDEGPDGYLYLTDQRLLFEQKEEVAEKKFLFITTKSTEVQKLLVDTELRYIGKVEHSEEKRRTLQWGSDEILSMTITGQADLSRLRFHIKNQQADDWKELIQFVLSGEIQEDRFDYDPEAALEKLVFPASCPNCMAAIPPQPAGVSAYECEFCGATIQATTA